MKYQSQEEKEMIKLAIKEIEALNLFSAEPSIRDYATRTIALSVVESNIYQTAIFIWRSTKLKHDESEKIALDLINKIHGTDFKN